MLMSVLFTLFDFFYNFGLAGGSSHPGVNLRQPTPNRKSPRPVRLPLFAEPVVDRVAVHGHFVRSAAWQDSVMAWVPHEKAYQLGLGLKPSALMFDAPKNLPGSCFPSPFEQLVPYRENAAQDGADIFGDEAGAMRVGRMRCSLSLRAAMRARWPKAVT